MAELAQAEALDQRGLALQDQGRLEEAAACFWQAIRLRPSFATAYNNLAGVLLRQGQRSEAIRCLREAIRLEPQRAEPHFNLGNLLQGLGDLTGAAGCYREALRWEPGHVQAHFNLGLTLAADRHYGPAQACFREALSLQPNLAGAHANLGHLLLQEGQHDQAVNHFHEALRVEPACANALAATAYHDLFPLSAEERERMDALLSSPTLNAEDACLLHFALGHLLDRKGDSDAAFAHFQEANRLRHQDFQAAGQAFDAQEHRRWIDRVIACCDAGFFRRTESWGEPAERPVFIVGMPRSGTTLVEQVLASHPQVFGAGELQEISKIARLLPGRLGLAERFPDCLILLNAGVARELGRLYLQVLTHLNREVLRVTDKMPSNFQFLGLIAALFPGARVIHCRRDPRDVCFSCYTHDFKDWTTNLDTLASYHRDYARLMEHWRRVLPLPLFEVDYEEMVADLEGVARRLVSFCGLPWDGRCLDYHRNRRAVRTASVLQVREPVYRRSVGRWQRYGRYLGPLIEKLSAGC